jgi:hypothetical protein
LYTPDTSAPVPGAKMFSLNENITISSLFIYCC